MHDELFGQGFAALGGALGALIGQFLFTTRRVRKVVDQVVARELGPIELRLEALETHNGWAPRKKKPTTEDAP